MKAMNRTRRAAFLSIFLKRIACAFASATLLSAPARAELVKLDIGRAAGAAPRSVQAAVKIDGLLYAIAGTLEQPTKPASNSLLVETQASEDIKTLALERGMAVLTLDLSKIPETAKATALRDVVKHMRGATKAKRVLGRAQGADAEILADATSSFDGLLLHDARRLPAPPTRFIETWGADAYWRAAPRAESENSEPPNGRRFYLAGTAAASAITNCAAPINMRAIAPALRALLIALDDWAAKGVAPPASRAPAAGDLVAMRDLNWPKIPGLPAPPEGDRRAPKIDADGNEVAGLRLPDHALPSATFTGFNAQKDKAGPPCAAGAALTFAANKAEREKNGDARPSLVERYGSRAYFVATMRVVADKLVKERLLLPQDADAYVAGAKTAPF